MNMFKKPKLNSLLLVLFCLSVLLAMNYILFIEFFVLFL